MKVHVEKQGEQVSIQIEGVAGREQAVIDGIRRCRQSAWACQSGECVNIGSMQEHVEDGSVRLTLVPGPDAQINPAGIEICLRYLLAPQEGPARG
ncbi:MAG: hypothetical protein AMJ64_12025 [Betaproteobacteria bacterium SG8_39]|nr:MAG: hypothetical protein AMJ64_12025 [Betaproteobacteria bacterium SG8_39]